MNEKTHRDAQFPSVSATYLYQVYIFVLVNVQLL